MYGVAMSFMFRIRNAICDEIFVGHSQVPKARSRKAGEVGCRRTQRREPHGVACSMERPAETRCCTLSDKFDGLD